MPRPLIAMPALDEHHIEERCFIAELLNTAQDPSVSVARARVEPGVTTKRHRVVGTEERYIVVQGTGEMRIEESAARTVRVGDVVRIPAGAGQCIRNAGDEDLIFLCVCTPRFEWRNYELLE
jgi:mannose-6-phosphate isomerase-like protein (cupin superfamily)